jgi:hypothetical protein
MHDDETLTPDIAAEVRQWLGLLLETRGDQRREAAAQLGRLGIWSRGGTTPRGSLALAAQNRLPQREKIGDVVDALDDP